MKISKAIKDPFDLTKIYDYIFEKFADLKLFFMYNACHSAYPTVSRTQLEDICEQYSLLDKNLKFS